MLKEIKNLLAFLTILPIRMDNDCLTDSAKYMFLFPLIGALVGLLAGLFGWVSSLFLPGLVVGALALAMLLLLTGLHHTDGLLDFGDAVMYHGTPERKIEIMHDQLTGAGGLTLGIMTILISALCIGQIRSNLLVPGLVAVEVSAKLSMVVGAWAGKAVHKGMSSSFLEAMHGRKGDFRLLAAIVISFAISILSLIATFLFSSGTSLPILFLTGFAVVIASITSGFIMVLISHRHFGGVTGDVLGATNEISRMVSLIVFLAMIR
jgi:adenosylcobinamide-GDP ribazoletransferase